METRERDLKEQDRTENPSDMSDGGDNENADMSDDEEEESSSYDDDDDESSYDSDIDQEAHRLMVALQGGEEQDTQSPEERWNDFCQALATGQSTALKITDDMVEWVANMMDDDNDHSEERLQLTATLCQDVVTALSQATGINVVILGRSFLSLLSDGQQAQVYQGIAQRHAETVRFWKQGSDDSVDPCGMATDALLQTWASTSWPALTEVELRGLSMESDLRPLLLEFLQKTSSIRQCNLLGVVLCDELLQKEGLLDPVFQLVQTIQGFDELQVQVTRHENAMSGKKSLVPLLTPDILAQMLKTKPKWWRLRLDGLALDDRHVQILAAALQASADCKMNDLLSLRDNPNITDAGLEHLYTVCINKQRMGLVLSDNAVWVATFDLVRPLNNLHRRLEYRNGTQYKSRAEWVDWLSVVANLPWIEDARKINYVWFTLLEQPGWVQLTASD